MRRELPRRIDGIHGARKGVRAREVVGDGDEPPCASPRKSQSTCEAQSPGGCHAESVSPFGTEIELDRKRRRRRRHDGVRAEKARDRAVHVAGCEPHVGARREHPSEGVAVFEGFVHLRHPRVEGRVVHEKDRGLLDARTAVLVEDRLQARERRRFRFAPVRARNQGVEPHGAKVLRFESEFDGVVRRSRFGRLRQSREVRAHGAPRIVVPGEHPHGRGEAREDFVHVSVRFDVSVAGDVARDDDEVDLARLGFEPGAKRVESRGRIGLAVGEHAPRFDVKVGELKNRAHRSLPREGHQVRRVDREARTRARTDRFARGCEIHLQEFPGGGLDRHANEISHEVKVLHLDDAILERDALALFERFEGRHLGAEVDVDRTRVVRKPRGDAVRKGVRGRRSAEPGEHPRLVGAAHAVAAAHEPRDEPRGRTTPDFFGRRRLVNDAPFHDDDPVAEHHGFVLVVRYKYTRNSKLCNHTSKPQSQFRTNLCINGGKWFIKQKNIRVKCKGSY